MSTDTNTTEPAAGRRRRGAARPNGSLRPEAGPAAGRADAAQPGEAEESIELERPVAADGERGVEPATIPELGAEPTAAAPDRDQYLRLAADFENFRRRSQQELLDRSRYASAEAARELVPVLDNLRRAVDHVPADGSADDNLRDGLMLVVREFESALERIGVVAIDSVGSAFDPALHEAVGGEESEQVDRDTVIHELQRGYRLHDRVLRPALVRIAHPKS